MPYVLIVVITLQAVVNCGVLTQFLKKCLRHTGESAVRHS